MGRGQKMANMSTVAIMVTFILFIKEAPNEIHSHQEPLLLNIWGTLTVLTLKNKRQIVCKKIENAATN